MTAAQVIVVGSYVQDQAWFVDRFARPGETLRANRYNTGPGGKGFNQAIACTRQGVATAFVGAIGRDTFAEFAQQFARAEGMPCRWQIRDDQPTATASISVNARAENQIAMIFGANEHLDPAFVCAQDDLFAQSQVLLLQLENNPDATAAALTMAERHQLVRILNPAPVHADLDVALLQRADIITPNETEFSLLLERCAGIDTDPTTLAAQDDARLHALARRLGLENDLPSFVFDPLDDEGFVGPDAAVVYKGPGSLSSPGCRQPGPCPFDMVIPFATPFTYDPNKGRLLIDFLGSASTGTTSGSLDAVGVIYDIVFLLLRRSNDRQRGPVLRDRCMQRQPAKITLQFFRQVSW